MNRKHLVLIGLMLWSVIAHAQKSNPFYYELISNDSKTTNFVFGFYPNSYSYVESKEVDPYTSVKAAVINNSTQSLKWNNYKVVILLKNGKLIRSYTTAATDGDYACNYTVDAAGAKGTTRLQYFCFHTKFTAEDIDKVFLEISDNQIFGLMYDKNES